MPTITDTDVIGFANSHVRTTADRLATLYYECQFLEQLRDADADTATTISLREPRIRSVADYMLSVIRLIDEIPLIWFNVGTGGTISSKTNNSEAFDVGDGSPGDGRPGITGADIHRIITLNEGFQDWLKDAAFGGPGTGTQRDAMLNTMLVCSSSGNRPLQDAQVTTFIDNRCGEIVIEYEATGNQKLSYLLGVAPNPRVTN